MNNNEISSVKDCMTILETKIKHCFDMPLKEGYIKLEKCSFSSEKPDDHFCESIGWKISSTIDGKEESVYIVAGDFNIFGIFTAYLESVYTNGRLELYSSNYIIDENNEIHQKNTNLDESFKEIHNREIDKTVKAYKESCLDLIKK